MSKRNENESSKGRIGYLFLVAVLSVLGGYFLGDGLRLSEKPSEYIGLVFSILAASVFAVVSIVGDPGMLASGGSKEAWENAKELRRELQQFNWLFILYLIVLGLLVATELVEYSKLKQFYWLFNAFGFFAIAGFLLSLALPFEFSKIQKRRLEQEIRNRKSKRQV